MDYAEKSLGIKLPDDFKELNSCYRYDYIGAWPFFNWRTDPNDDTSVVIATKMIRKGWGLPNNYLALSEPGDDIILFKTPIKEDSSSSVIWCAVEDFYNLSEGKPMIYNPTIFPSFTDFFEFLIKRERKTER